MVFTHEYSSHIYIGNSYSQLTSILFGKQNLFPKGMLYNAVACPHPVRSGMSTA